MISNAINKLLKTAIICYNRIGQICKVRRIESIKNKKR